VRIENLAAVPSSQIHGLPENFDRYSDPRDRQLTRITEALQRKVNFADNFNAEEKALVVRHLVPLDVSFPTILSKIRYVFLGLTEIEDFVQLKVRLLSSNSARLTFSFSTAPTTAQNVSVIALGQ
jgi:hypothetical protein